MLLAVDGGGTKTHVLLAHDNGIVISETFSGPTSFAVVTPEESRANLKAAIVELQNGQPNIKCTFSRVLIGLAGVDTAYEVEAAERTFQIMLTDYGNPQLRIVNDSLIALASGTDAEDAIVLISGTGSNCFGKNHDGETAKAGGLDYLLSDEGSSYYVGKEVLTAAIRSYDGRGEKTILEDLVKQAFDIREIPDLKMKVNRENFNKTTVAQLSLLATQAKDENDSVAIHILNRAMEELVLMVEAVARRLRFQNNPFDLVLTGSMFSRRVLPLETFMQTIKNRYRGVTFIQPSDPPVYGALKLININPQ